MIGWVRRGRLSGVADLSFRAVPFLGIAVLLVLLARAPWIPPSAGRALLGGGYLLALAILWLNRAYPWILVVLLGTALNTAAIFANGGRMPVSRDALSHIAHPLVLALHPEGDPRHVLAGPGSPLSFLGDVLALEIGGIGVIVSVGDLLMAVGIAGLVQAAMRRQPRSS